MVWITASVATFFLLVSTHSFVSYPISLFVLRTLKPNVRPRAAVGADVVGGLSADKTFAICMCAYNEESVIVAKAENMLKVASAVTSCELRIYVDGASDRTIELLQPYTDRIDIVVGAIRMGKSHGMNIIVGRCHADIIVFTDANVELKEDVLVQLAPHFADPTIGCVCGNLIYRNPEASAMSGSSSLYWQLEEMVKQLESDVFSVIGADGSLFAIRRELHETVPDDIIDDFYVSMKILMNGARVVREEKAMAFELSATDMGQEFRRKIRIACQAFNVHRLIWSGIVRSPMLFYCYVSHRLLKWLSIFNLIISAVFAFATAFLLFDAFVVILFTGAVALAFFAALAAKLRPAEQILSILMSLVGAGLGVLRSLRGDRFQTWAPVTSARQENRIN